MKTYIVVDIEANGPIPGDNSMTSLGAVIVDHKLDKTFKINILPISEKYDEDRLKYVDTNSAVNAKDAMHKFKNWIEENVSSKPVFVSDNNGFDWMFVCWYFWHFLGENPLGYNSTNMNSIYKGMKRDMSVNIDELREQGLKHDALQDALDNAKILNKIFEDTKPEH